MTAVLDLARELGVRVVAEGIESVEQDSGAASSWAARYGQGFLYSRPVPERSSASCSTGQHTTVG